LVVAASILLASLIPPRASSLGQMSYTVTTLGARDSASTALLRATLDGLLEWRGVTARGAGQVADLRGALADAISGHSRNLVTLVAKQEGGSVMARATLYDVAHDSALRSTRVTLAGNASASDRMMAIRRLVNDLIRGDGDELPWAAASDSSTPRLDAWRAYDAGRLALREWNLTAADAAFRLSISLDPQLAHAYLWLAQTIQWTDTSRILDQRLSAQKALGFRRRLSATDSEVAVALASDEQAIACQTYRHLLANDSSDFRALLGLGDCETHDRLVIPSRRTNTGWVFRTSFEDVARVYLRASHAAGAPADSRFQGWLLGRLSDVLFAVTNHVRLGTSLSPSELNFGALPFLDHDTLAFSPYPLRELASGRLDPPPILVDSAVRRNREFLRRVSEGWVQAAPQDPDALDSLAAWTEVSGGIGHVGTHDVGTLEIVQAARALSRSKSQQLRLAIMQARLYVKAGRFDEARELADSILQSNPVGSPTQSTVGLAGLAALVGRVEVAARFAAASRRDRRVTTADGQTIQLPAELQSLAARLSIYATLGGSEDSVHSLGSRTIDLIGSSFPDSATAAQVRGALAGPALASAFPVAGDLLRLVVDIPDLTSRAIGMFAKGDTSSAKEILAQTQRLVRGRSPGASVDRRYRRARLALLLSDTASAIQELDPVLRGLPTLGASLLQEPAQIGSLVRAFTLRSQIATKRDDAPTAEEFHNAVKSLWRGADPKLRAQ
jgi:hypothetical protein